ncbi:hypothetical protein HPB49_020592 [Dermacentor silvarum]|uniref:Uncharacterized protein n=1 Tax=Dermacentor silvarum TaxID=543639 RepID=A0ACB8CHA1_DERSI|nr:hypothetical protein HPB49_020592 [Dermacentor silvarum]
MPQLPEEDYKILLRPKCAVNLSNIGLIALFEAIYATSKINQAQAEQADQVRVHPIKNTITISLVHPIERGRKLIGLLHFYAVKSITSTYRYRRTYRLRTTPYGDWSTEPILTKRTKPFTMK